MTTCDCHCDHPECPRRRAQELGLVVADTLNGVPHHIKGSHGPRAEAPEEWHLPMKFRAYNPWGWKHGEINAKGQLHPGFDFNDGPSAVADRGLPLYAARPGIVTYAKRVAGWGTLIAIKLDELVDGREVFIRYGHPHDIFVQWGEHVEAGQVIGTCGDGHLPNLYTPHLHYDIGYVDALWEATKSRGLGKPDYNWYQQTPANFDKIYIDPGRFHPEVRAWFAKNPEARTSRMIQGGHYGL